MKRLIALLVLLAATAAMAADNPISCSGNSCKQMFYTRTSGGVQTQGGQLDGTGAWTLGPLITGNANGQRHLISGGLYAANVTSTSNSGVFVFGTNARGNASNALNGRTDTTTSGLGVNMYNNTSASTVSWEMYANQPGDSTTTAGVDISTATPAGAWTFGNAAGTTDTLHTVYGSLTLDKSAQAVRSNEITMRDGSTGGSGFQIISFGKFSLTVGGGLTTVATVPTRSSGHVEFGLCDASSGGASQNYMAMMYWSSDNAGTTSFTLEEKVGAANGDADFSGRNFRVSAIGSGGDEWCATFYLMVQNAGTMSWSL